MRNTCVSVFTSEQSKKYNMRSCQKVCDALRYLLDRLAPVFCLKTEPSELDWLQVYDDTLMKNCFKDLSQSIFVSTIKPRKFECRMLEILVNSNKISTTMNTENRAYL